MRLHTSGAVDASKVLSLALLFLSLLILWFYFLMLFLGPETFEIALSMRGKPLYVGRISFYFLSVIPAEIKIPRIDSRPVFSVLLLIFGLLLITLPFQGRDPISAARGGSALDNALIGTLVLSGGTFAFMIALSFLLEMGGVEIGGLTYEDKALEYIEVTYASLREEIGFRLTFVGFFALLSYSLVSRRIPSPKEVLIGLFRPTSLPIEGNLRKTYLLSLWGFVLFSSILFGFAHLFSPTGWGVGKAITASLAGVLLGYLYVRYGLFSSIISHWSFNYVSETLTISASVSSWSIALFKVIVVIYYLSLVLSLALILVRFKRKLLEEG